MTKLSKILTVLGIFLIASTSWAANIGVVYNGNTEVNRETFMFFSKVIGQTSYKHDFAIQSPTSAPAAKFKGLIILNTGRESGTDPVLASFVQKNKGKIPMVLVNLYTNKDAITVESMPAAKSALGVDTVSSASLWGKGGRGAGMMPPADGKRPQRPEGANPDNAQGQGAAKGNGAGFARNGLNPLEAMHLEWFKTALDLLKV